MVNGWSQNQNVPPPWGCSEDHSKPFGTKIGSFAWKKPLEPWKIRNGLFSLWKCWFLYIACKLILSKRPEILNRAYPFIIKVTYHPQEDHPPPQGRSTTNLRMVTNQPKDGHPKKRRKCTTDMEFGTYTLLTKLTPGDNCHWWSPTILRRVTCQPWDGHPPIKEWSPCLAPFDTTWP